MSIKSLYGRFPVEGEIIGRLLAGYTDLELCVTLAVVHTSKDSFDSIIKRVYKRMGEQKRIILITQLGIDGFKTLDLEAEFVEGIALFDYCRTIRNQYAHSVFWDDWGENFGFGNLEDIARQALPLKSFNTLPRKPIDVPTLQLQEDYFEHVESYFLWLVNEGRRRSNLQYTSRLKPPTLPQPRLCSA